MLIVLDLGGYPDSNRDQTVPHTVALPLNHIHLKLYAVLNKIILFFSNCIIYYVFLYFFFFSYCIILYVFCLFIFLVRNMSLVK